MSVQSIERAFHILRAVAEAPEGIGITELAQRTDLHKSTVSRLVAALEAEAAVVDAAAIRAQPIALTGAAAMVGAFFILDDPIFNGLAVALIFGVLVSTLLTLVVIPLLHYGVVRRRMAARRAPPPEPAAAD